MLAVDIAEFTRADRDDEVQLQLRISFYGILREALGGSGMPWDQCQHEDRGDGVVVIVPPGLPAQPIIDSLPERLRCLIRRHNRFSYESVRMQLRVAANIGPVYGDEHGFSGDDVTLLCRMLDAQPLRRAGPNRAPRSRSSSPTTSTTSSFSAARAWPARDRSAE